MWRKPSWDVQIPLPNKYSVLLKAINGYRALCLRFIAFGYHVCIHMVLSLLQHLAVNSLSVFLFQLEEELPLFSLGQESCWPTASFFPWPGKLLANCSSQICYRSDLLNLKAFGSTKVQLSLVVVAFHAPILSGEKTPLQHTFHAQPLFWRQTSI